MTYHSHNPKRTGPNHRRLEDTQVILPVHAEDRQPDGKYLLMGRKLGKRCTGRTLDDPGRDLGAELNVEVVLNQGQHGMSASPEGKLVGTREIVEGAGLARRTDRRLEQRSAQGEGPVKVRLFSGRSAGDAVIRVLGAEQGQIDGSAEGLTGSQRCYELGNGIVETNPQNLVLWSLLIQGPPQIEALFAHYVIVQQCVTEGTDGRNVAMKGSVNGLDPDGLCVCEVASWREPSASRNQAALCHVFRSQ